MKSLGVRRAWTNILLIPRDHRYQSTLLYPAKLSIILEGQNKVFHDKTRFHQYLVTNPALHKVLEGKFQPNEVGYINKNTNI